uniref:MADF domain-containing protein n=1 Tax=Glossina austeni TaxID=7395 RepID=A0A1A9VVT6_GLOAU
MAITANKKFWTEFINLYENLPCLWNSKHEDYSNREKRNESWDKMVEKLKDIEPDANHDAVKRKINTFRSNFNREVRKIKQSRNNGIDEYNPTLWYFEQLSFLLEQQKYSEKNAFRFDETNLTAYDDDTKLTVGYPMKCEIETLDSPRSNDDNESRMQDDRMKRSLGRRTCRKLPLSKTAEKLQNFDEDQKQPWIRNMGDTMSRISPHLAFEEQNNRNQALSLPSAFNSIIRKSQSRYRKTSPGIKQDADHTCETNEEENNEKSLPIVQEDIRNSGTKRSSESFPSDSNQLGKQTKFQRLSLSPQPAIYHENRVNANQSDCIDNDEADIYARAWACGYRKLSSEQKLYAKKAMDEILVMGQLNALNLHTIMIKPAMLSDGGGGGNGAICSE